MIIIRVIIILSLSLSLSFISSPPFHLSNSHPFLTSSPPPNETETLEERVARAAAFARERAAKWSAMAPASSSGSPEAPSLSSYGGLLLCEIVLFAINAPPESIRMLMLLLLIFIAVNVSFDDITRPPMLTFE
jgi:hypothetical protein